MTRHDPESIHSRTKSPHFRAVLQERLSRRDLLKSSVGAAAAIAVAPGFAGSIFGGDAIAGGAQSSLTFSELKRVYDQTHHVAPGYNADMLLRWGDKLDRGRCRRSMPQRKLPNPRPSNLATITTLSAICRCHWARAVPTMACFASITNIPIRM